jgi:NADPH-dependent 2,4-dienoyl-CoA reductase/sulfur reductase-like enzyme
MYSADVVVVGASTGGVRTVQALRRSGFDGSIALLSDERHLPYDRPPLSKELLGADHPGVPVPLLTEQQVADLDVDLHLATTATGLDPHARRLRVSRNGGVASLAYDRLVIATGVTARTLPGTDDIDGVHVIRSLDDTRALRDRMAPGVRAVVVGAGFIGAEFAAAARARGLEVVVVEAQETPMAHALGAQVGGAVGLLHEQHGTRLITDHTVAEVRHAKWTVNGVVLDDGTELPADLVVVGIGASPATEWLDGAGLPVDDGIACDADLLVHGFADIHAVGDIARWPHPRYAEPIRVEHWTNAGDHAEIVAAFVTGKPRPRPALPYVWSDQYGRRLQIIGRPVAGTEVSLHGSVAGGDLVALYADSSGAMVAAVVVDNPRLMLKCRKAIEAGSPLSELAAAQADRLTRST